MMLHFFQFYNFITKMRKRKKENDTFMKGEAEDKQLCYHNDICRGKRDSFPNEVEITKGIV